MREGDIMITSVQMNQIFWLDQYSGGKIDSSNTEGVDILIPSLQN